MDRKLEKMLQATKYSMEVKSNMEKLLDEILKLEEQIDWPDEPGIPDFTRLTASQRTDYYNKLAMYYLLTAALIPEDGEQRLYCELGGLNYFCEARTHQKQPARKKSRRVIRTRDTKKPRGPIWTRDTKKPRGPIWTKDSKKR